MTPEQLEDLFIELSLYTKFQKQLIIMTFLETAKDGNGVFLKFLKDKLEIEGYWKQVAWRRVAGDIVARFPENFQEGERLLIVSRKKVAGWRGELVDQTAYRRLKRYVSVCIEWVRKQS